MFSFAFHVVDGGGSGGEQMMLSAVPAAPPLSSIAAAPLSSITAPSSRVPVSVVEAKTAACYESLANHAVEVAVRETAVTLRRVKMNAGGRQASLPEGYEPDHDVVTGKYEGGLKVWECSMDLCHFLVTPSGEAYFRRPDSAPCAILELGCGQGFPGILCLQRVPGCEVVFSDLNREVLEETTWPNIFLNCPERLAFAECVAGDWDSLLQSTVLKSSDGSPRLFDVILSAETLYTGDCCRRVHAILQAHLHPDGFAFLATKRYYFGLGGGLAAFTSVCEASQELQVTVVKSFEDGQSNVRELLHISRVHSGREL